MILPTPDCSTNRSGRQHLWAELANSMGYSPHFMTPEALKNIAAVLVQAGFRTAPAYLSMGKAMHIAAGHSWSEQLAAAQADAGRAARRGLGPPRRTAALPLLPLADLESEFDHTEGGPWGPGTALS